jgi:hypothetical protein
MDEVQVAAQDYRRRFFGAAQIQLAYPGGLTSKQRDEIFQTFIAANRHVIEKICATTSS